MRTWSYLCGIRLNPQLDLVRRSCVINSTARVLKKDWRVLNDQLWDPIDNRQVQPWLTVLELKAREFVR